MLRLCRPVIALSINIILLCHGQIYVRKDTGAKSNNNVLEVSLPSDAEKCGEDAEQTLQNRVDELLSHIRQRRDTDHHIGHPYTASVRNCCPILFLSLESVSNLVGPQV